MSLMSYIKAWFGETQHLRETFHSNRIVHCLNGLGELHELVKYKGSEFVIASSISG